MKFSESFKALNEKLALASGVIILIIGALAVFEAFVRTVFNSPTKYTADINNYCLIWAIFLVAGYAFQVRGHVRVDLLTKALSTSKQRVLAIISNFVCLFFVSLFAHSSFNIMIATYQLNAYTYAVTPIPKWILIMAIFIGSVMMFITLVRIIIDLFKKNDYYL